jgi:hypothetical protein
MGRPHSSRTSGVFFFGACVWLCASDWDAEAGPEENCATKKKGNTGRSEVKNVFDASQSTTSGILAAKDFRCDEMDGMAGRCVECVE